MGWLVKNLPNLITLCNLLTGLLGVVEIFQGDHQRAIFYVLIAGLFDFLDGFLARFLRLKSDIGAQLDSLADMISFSALPALFLFRHLQLMNLDGLAYAGLLVAAFSAWRLAVFNIDDSQTDVFRGLPTPANAIMITSLVYLDIHNPWWWGLIVSTSCFLLVAPVKMLALKFSSFRLRGNALRYLLIVLSVVILAIFGVAGVAFVIPAYILLSFVANFTS